MCDVHPVEGKYNVLVVKIAKINYEYCIIAIDYKSCYY